MSYTIHKYALGIGDHTISMPWDSEILCVQMQYNMPQMWVRCDQSKMTASRKISVRGTGHILTGWEGKYIGTFQAGGGDLVWHVFDGGEA